MSINLRLATPEDAGRWNEIVDREPQGSFFDRYEWCESLGTVSPKVTPFPVLIEEDGEVVGVFPSCLIKDPLRTSLESLPFSDYGGGPLFRQNVMANGRGFLSAFVGRLIELGCKNDCMNITIRRAYFKDLVDKKLIKKPLVTDISNCTFIVSLSEGTDKIYRNLDKSRRVSIKEGKRRGAVVLDAEDSNDLQRYYETYTHTMKRLKSTPLPYRFFEHVWETFAPRNDVKIFLAEYEGRCIAGVLLLIHKKVCHWAGNVSLEGFWDKRPTDLLLWHSIEWAAANNLDLFDMGSTTNDSTSGHYFFKKSWGGQEMLLYNYNVLLQVFKWNLYKSSYKLLNRIRSIF